MEVNWVPLLMGLQSWRLMTRAGASVRHPQTPSSPSEPLSLSSLQLLSSLFLSVLRWLSKHLRVSSHFWVFIIHPCPQLQIFISCRPQSASKTINPETCYMAEQSKLYFFLTGSSKILAFVSLTPKAVCFSKANIPATISHAAPFLTTGFANHHLRVTANPHTNEWDLWQSLILSQWCLGRNGQKTGNTQIYHLLTPLALHINESLRNGSCFVFFFLIAQFAFHSWRF